jgi:hypothetical protein
MTLASPASISISGAAGSPFSLVKVNQDNNTSKYLFAGTGVEIELNVRHSYEGKAGPGQMVRHNLELIRRLWGVDGVVTTRNAYMVLRSPRGEDPLLVFDVLDGLKIWANANRATLAQNDT